MKLYFSKGACSLAVRIIINELNLSCEYAAVNLKTKVTGNGTNFLTINPKGTVPTLITDDNQTLTENAAIQIYLAEKNQATQLLPPPSDFKRYRVLEWLIYITTELHKNFGPFFNPQIPEEVKEKVFTAMLQKKLQFVNYALQNKKYLIGDQFTLPDGYLFVMLTWVIHFKLRINEYPNLLRYFEELKKRKSIAKSLQEEGIG